MALIHSLVDGATLTGFVRNVPNPSNFILNQFLPDRQIQDIEAVIDSVTRTNRAATFRTFDAETPIGKRDTASKTRVGLPPVGQKTVVGEEERLKLEAARLGGDANAAILESIYDDAAVNTRAVRARVELARGDLLEDGVVEITENGLAIEADFGIDGSHTETATVSWDNYSTADPIEELLGWVETYTADAGEPPAVAVTSTKVIASLLRNDSIAKLAASVAGAPGIVTRTALDQVFESYGLPRLVAADARVDVNGASTRTFNENMISFVPANPADLGYTAWGITAEALELVGDPAVSFSFQDAPGLVGVVMKDGDPVRTWTKVTGVCLPVIVDPAKFFSATVIVPAS